MTDRVDDVVGVGVVEGVLVVELVKEIDDVTPAVLVAVPDAATVTEGVGVVDRVGVGVVVTEFDSEIDTERDIDTDVETVAALEFDADATTEGDRVNDELGVVVVVAVLAAMLNLVNGTNVNPLVPYVSKSVPWKGNLRSTGLLPLESLVSIMMTSGTLVSGTKPNNPPLRSARY